MNLFDAELQLINTKPLIKKKLKDQSILVLQCNKGNDHKIFHLSVKLIASDSNTDEAFKSMYEAIMRKMKNSDSKYWVVIKTTVKRSIQIFEC